MKYVFRKLKCRLCLLSPRYKLHCIRRALNLKPVQWQTRFALGRSNWLPLPTDRRSGKTVAVMLRILMQDPKVLAPHSWLRLDPDYRPGNYAMDRWYRRTYLGLAQKCKDAGIPVPNPIMGLKK